MKKILLASLLLSFNFLTFCQNKKPADSAAKVDSSKLPAYLRTKDLPVIKLYADIKTKDGKQDTTLFTNANLPDNKPTVIIYFSPECGHCQHEMKEIEKNMDSLKNAFFVFVSRFPVDSIKNFEKKYRKTAWNYSCNRTDRIRKNHHSLCFFTKNIFTRNKNNHH